MFAIASFNQKCVIGQMVSEIVSKEPMNNESALVQVAAWTRTEAELSLEQNLDPDGPHVGPMNLAIKVYMESRPHDAAIRSRTYRHVGNSCDVLCCQGAFVICPWVKKILNTPREFGNCLYQSNYLSFVPVRHLRLLKMHIPTKSDFGFHVCEQFDDTSI